MDLVVAGQQQPALAEHQQAVEEAAQARRCRRCALRPQRAGDEERALGQQLADGGQRSRRVERQERHGGFGPDHVRDAGEVVDLAGRIAPRQSEMVEENALLVLRRAISPAAERSAARSGF